MLLRKHETVSLYYNQYSYKLVCRNDLAPIFRNNRLGYVCKVLDNLQRLYEEGEPLTIAGYRTRIIDINSLTDAQILYNSFKQKKNNYRLRIQFKEINIYTDDRLWLENISTKIDQALEWYEPKGELLPSQPGKCYLKRDNGHQYRVYLKDKIPPDSIAWLTNNQDKIKIGPGFLKDLHEGFLYCEGKYIYAKNDRILNLLNLLMGANIRRIDKVVTNR